MSVETCRDIRRRLWDLLDGDLDKVGRAEVEAHLAGCEECRREMESRRRLWAMLDLDTVPDARDLTQRIMNRVGAQSRRRTGRRWLRWGAVAAAAACLILALTLALVRQPDDTTKPFIQEPPYLETQLVDLENVSDIELLCSVDFLETFVDGDMATDPNGI